jgi:hypothetical protein
VRAIVHGDPQGAREHAALDLTAAWAEAFLRHGSAAGQAPLDEARAIAEALREEFGETMAADSVAAIDAAAREGDTARLASLAAGHLSYRKALASGLDVQRSRRLLAKAGSILARGGSPFVLWAELQVAICDYRESMYRRTLAALRRIEETAGTRYPSLRAKALRVIGLSYGVLADYSRAREALAESARLYRQGGETENLSAVLTFLATTEQVLGDEAEAWRVRCQALRLARQLRAPPYLLLSDSALDVFSQGQPRIALLFQDEAVRLAELAQDPMVLAESRRIRAAILHRLGRTALASADLDRGMADLQRVRDAGLRRSLRADLLAVLAEMARAAEPRRAIALYQEVLASYGASGYHHYLAQLHQRCAEAYVAISDLEAAEREYQAAIAEREQQRALLLEERQRTTFLDDVRPVFDEMVDFQLSRPESPSRSSAGGGGHRPAVRSRFLAPASRRRGDAPGGAGRSGGPGRRSFRQPRPGRSGSRAARWMAILRARPSWRSAAGGASSRDASSSCQTTSGLA